MPVLTIRFAGSVNLQILPGVESRVVESFRALGVDALSDGDLGRGTVRVLGFVDDWCCG